MQIRKPGSTEDEAVYYEEALKRAHEYASGDKGGEIEDALELLEGYRAAYVYDLPLPPAIARYIYEAIDKYLRGSHKAPDSDVRARLLHAAFLLRAPAGRPSHITTTDPVAAVAKMYLKMTRGGLSKEEAKRATADEVNISIRRLEDYDREWNAIRSLNPDELATLIEARDQTRKRSQ